VGIRFADHRRPMDADNPAPARNVAHARPLKIRDKAEALAYFTKLLGS